MNKLFQKIAGLLPHNIIGAGLASMVIKFLGAIMSYGMIVAFARFMTVEEYGRFAFGINLAIIVSVIGGFGFTTAILRYWPKYIVAGDIAGARGVVRLGYLAVLCGSLIFLVPNIVIAIGSYYLYGTIHNAEFLAISCLALVLGVGDYSTNLLRAQGSVVVSMLPRDVLWRLLSVVAAAAVIWLGYSISGPVAILLCAIVMLVLVAWQLIAIRNTVRKVSNTNESRNDWKLVTSSLLPIWASSIIIAMIQQFDVVIVGTFLSSADAGAYFAAQKTAALLSLVLIVASLVAAPTMSKLYHSDKHDELQRLCRNLAGVIVFVTAIGFLVLAISGRFLLALFDPNFVSAYWILIIVAIGTMVDAIAGPNAYLMQMTAFERPYLRIMVVCYSVVLIAQLILLPKFGALGAAAASAGGVVAWNVWAIVILRRDASLDPSLLALFSSPRPKK